MKKTTLLMTLFFLFFLIGCSFSQSNNTQKIDIQNIGSLYVPKDWKVSYEDNTICFISEQTHYYMIGCLQDFGSGNGYNHPYLIDFEKGEIISSEVYSNSVIVSENECTINGESIIKRFMSCYVTSAKRLNFIVLDDSITNDTLEKIGKSFDRIN